MGFLGETGRIYEAMVWLATATYVVVFVVNAWYAVDVVHLYARFPMIRVRATATLSVGCECSCPDRLQHWLHHMCKLSAAPEPGAHDVCTADWVILFHSAHTAASHSLTKSLGGCPIALHLASVLCLTATFSYYKTAPYSLLLLQMCTLQPSPTTTMHPPIHQLHQCRTHRLCSSKTAACADMRRRFMCKKNTWTMLCVFTNQYSRQCQSRPVSLASNERAAPHARWSVLDDQCLRSPARCKRCPQTMIAICPVGMKLWRITLLATKHGRSR